MPDIQLPELHVGQVKIVHERERFNAVRCGRRFGKDILQNTIAADAAARGFRAGLFAPRNDQLMEPFDAIAEILAPCKKRSSRTEGVFRTKNGGHVDIWTLDDNPLAGRGHEYDVICINEAAFSKNVQTLKTWREAMKPTLLTRYGQAWAFSTPFGIDPENFFYSLCNDKALGFKEHHAPSIANPYVPPDEIERERLTNHPLVFRQEFLAEFVDWSGVAFFDIQKWMGPLGHPIVIPTRCDGVFAVIDSAIKTGTDNDGTAVLYCAMNMHYGTPLILLDYDLIQIEGASLETWVPSVFARLEELAAATGSRQGVVSTFVEDKGSGTILIQQAATREWNITAIDSGLTAMGKDERALSVSGYHFQGKCQITQECFDKLVTFKGTTRNHLVSQVSSFRMGDKKAAKRADDCLDVYCYALAIALGTPEGY